MREMEEMAYQLACSMFSKMSNEQLINLKKMLEEDYKIEIGAERQASEDMLADLKRYIKEKGIEAVMDEAFKIAGYKTKGRAGCRAY